MSKQWMRWQTIDSLPDHGKQILVGFMGQFEWYSFVVSAYGNKTSYPGYSKPTHWTEIIPPEDS